MVLICEDECSAQLGVEEEVEKASLEQVKQLYAGKWLALLVTEETPAGEMYGIDLYCLLADTIAITFAGFFPDQTANEEAPHLETVYDSKGEWVRQLKLFALFSSDDGTGF